MQNILVNFLCIVVAFGYAIEIAVTDIKLKHLSSQFLTLCYSMGVAVIAIIMMIITRERITAIPSKSECLYIGVMIFFSFVAAIAHFLALHYGAGATKISMSYAMLPAIIALMAYIFKKETPEPRLVAAWILIGVAIYLTCTSKQLIE